MQLSYHDTYNSAAQSILTCIRERCCDCEDVDFFDVDMADNAKGWYLQGENETLDKYVGGDFEQLMTLLQPVEEGS